MLSFFRPKYKPTEQETQFLNIIEKLLEHPKTSVKTSSFSSKYFLINEQKHYYVLLQPNVIQLTNSKFSLIKNVHQRAYDMMIDTAKRLAHEFCGQVLDQNQQPLNRQLTEHYREFVMEFTRHHLMSKAV